MNQKVRVTNASNTRMLEIKVTSTNKNEVAIIANTYAEVVSAYIADKMHTDAPTIISSALQPSTPDSPSKTRNIIIGLLVGFMLSAGIVIVNFLLNDTIRNADDIQKSVGLITLAVIPVEQGKTETNRYPKHVHDNTSHPTHMK